MFERDAGLGLLCPATTATASVSNEYVGPAAPEWTSTKQQPYQWRSEARVEDERRGTAIDVGDRLGPC